MSDLRLRSKAKLVCCGFLGGLLLCCLLALVAVGVDVAEIGSVGGGTGSASGGTATARRYRTTTTVIAAGNLTASAGLKADGERDSPRPPREEGDPSKAAYAVHGVVRMPIQSPRRNVTGRYTGDVDESGRPHGLGKAVYETGHKYSGRWVHGTPTSRTERRAWGIAGNQQDKAGKQQDKDRTGNEGRAPTHPEQQHHHAQLMASQGAAAREDDSATKKKESIYRRWTGVYSDPRNGNRTVHPGGRTFDNVILITSSNWAYRDLLSNWECHASRLGLRWLVVSMDETMHAHLGPERSVLAEGVNITDHASRFRSRNFNAITCGKLRAVLGVLESGHEVLFSDPDNVLLRDPFQDVGFGGAGAMISSGRYDFLYSVNGRSEWLGHRGEKAKATLDEGVEPDHKRDHVMGNTGFYYASPTAGIRAWFADALRLCGEWEGLDDQTILWDKGLRAIREGRAAGPSAFRGTRHCSRDAWDDVTNAPERDGTVLDYCHLDPSRYRTGDERVEGGDPVVAFHANFCSGPAEKREKLGGYVDPSAWLLREDGSCGPYGAAATT